MMASSPTRNRLHVAATLSLLLGFFAASTTLAAGSVSPEWTAVARIAGELSFIRELTGYALDCPPADLPRAFAEAAALPEARRAPARALLIAAWVERDTPGAIAARNVKDSGWDAFDLSVFYQTLASASPEEALRLIDAEPASPERAHHLHAVLQALAEKRPELALREMRKRQGSDDFNKSPWIFLLWGGLAPAEALDATDRVEDEEKRENARISILQTWLAKTPGDAFAWINRNLKGEEGDALVTRLAETLAYTDWSGLRKLADSTDDPRLRALLDKAAVQALAWQPASRLWEHVSSRGWDNVPEHALSSLLEYAARRPASESAAFFKNVPARLLRHEHQIVDLAEAWSLADPDAALSWARGLANVELREAALLRVNTMLSELSPDHAIAHLEQTPPGPFQAKLARNIGRAIAKKDLPRATEWALSLPVGATQNEALDAVALIASRNNPKAFSAASAQLPEGLARGRLVGKFIAGWVDHDVAAATSWLFALPPGPERSAALQPAMNALANHAPEDAFRIAPSLTDRTERVALIQQLAETQAGRHPDEVLALVDTLPDSRDKDLIRDRALQQIAKDDPTIMAELISENTFGPPAANVVSAVLREWKGRPSEAASWLDGLLAQPANADLGPRVANSFVVSWTRQDPEAARTWVERLPAGRTRTTAADALTRQYAEIFPARSLDLAASLGVTDNTLKQITTSLSRNAPDRVRALIRDSALPEDRKTKALGWLKP